MILRAQATDGRNALTSSKRAYITIIASKMIGDFDLLFNFAKRLRDSQRKFPVSCLQRRFDGIVRDDEGNVRF